MKKVLFLLIAFWIIFSISAQQKVTPKNAVTKVQTQKADVITDKHFGPARVFKIKVPVNYEHYVQIDKFSKKYAKNFFWFNDSINDKNFEKASNKLIPGKIYTIKIFPILKKVKSEDCVAFIYSQNAFMIGAQGLSLVWELNKNQFPRGKRTISFDEKDSLFTDIDGYHEVPFVYFDTSGDIEFDLGYYEGNWRSDCYIICFL